jgi:hypothetical protein
VGDDGRAVVGFIALRHPDWIGHIYLHPDSTGHGLGTRMIELAKQELEGPIDNEEQAPDVRLLFTP